MKTTFATSRAELDAALAQMPREKAAFTSIMLYRGHLENGQNRGPVTPEIVYAVATPENEHSVPADVMETIRVQLWEHVTQGQNAGQADLYLPQSKISWAQQRGLPVPEPKHPLVRPMHLTHLWLPPTDQPPLISRQPVLLPTAPSSVALARSLHRETAWTPTSDPGDWPDCRLSGVQWTDTDGQMGTAPPEEFNAAHRTIPYRVESLRLRATIGDNEVTVPAHFFIDDRHRLTTTDAARGEFQMILQHLQHAASLATKHEPPGPDAILATALAHTAQREEAFQRYNAHIRRNYLIAQADIIDQQGEGDAERVQVIEYRTAAGDMEQALAELKEIADSIEDDHDPDETREALQACYQKLLHASGPQ